MPYTPHTQSEIADMLDVIGLEKESDLFNCIPDELKTEKLNLEDSKDEFTVFAQFKKLAQKNDTSKTIFMGGGYYDHIVPSAVDALAGRSEFYTAYTPYQAEASQGTLQSLYEYQTLICELTGMDVSNASMYDGATALAEAALMGVRISRRNKVLIDGGINPTYIKIVTTYLSFREIDFEIIPLKDNATDVETVKANIDSTTACYLFQNPNFFGSIEDFSDIADTLHENKALLVSSSYPIALGMIKDPVSMGVDIVSADGQCLGNYLAFGGPSFGMIATKQKYIRDLPGRIIGKTVDKDNKELFVLTMQAREQHIRRQRATSNICSNQNLLALRSTIFMSLIGKEGLVQMAELCYQKSEYLKSELSKIDGISIKSTTPTFNEFIIETPLNSSELLEKLKELGYYAGINLANLYEDKTNQVLISTTEKRTKDEINGLVSAIRSVI